MYNKCAYSFVNSFPLCSTRRVLYICVYVIVLYYVIPVTISCKSSYGGNEEEEEEEKEGEEEDTRTETVALASEQNE